MTKSNPIIVPYLPFQFNFEKLDLSNDDEDELGFPVFEPTKAEIWNQLIKKYIEIFFYRIIIESKLSEFSSRTIAMENSVAKTEEFA